MTMLACASSELDIRSAALALANRAPSSDAAAVDALSDAYARSRTNAFVGPALLEALSLLALRNAAARHAIAGFLLRLPSAATATPEESAFYIKGAQAIVRVDALTRSDDTLLSLLREWTASPDQGVQAQAHFALAVVELSRALREPVLAQFFVRLGQARAAFARAEYSEESRPDAAMLGAVLDMMLLFPKSIHGGDAAREELVRSAHALDVSVRAAWAHDARDYRSLRNERLFLAVARVGRALARSARMGAEADAWINFNEALVDLANVWLTLGLPETGHGRLELGLAQALPTLVAPTMGSVLAHAVGSLRMGRVLEALSNAGVDARLLDAVRLFKTAVDHDSSASAGVSPDTDLILAASRDLAVRHGVEVSTFLRSVLEAIRSGDASGYLAQLDAQQFRIESGRPGLFSQRPSVDAVVRRVLPQVHSQIGVLPASIRSRTIETLVHLLNRVELLRDTMPPFTVCTEDDGLGQRASERDLQDNLFESIRNEFGNGAIYEMPGLAGGRPDSGIYFPECRFPIEAKHEFHDVSGGHIRSAFLSQPDVYAACTNRVCFLTVLDLRTSNADGHVKRRPSGSAPPVGLYSLDASCWVDGLLPDPQVVGAKPNAVIVILVPGNRPRPSSMTRYSKRPPS
jgi:hypothetical protein